MSGRCATWFPPQPMRRRWRLAGSDDGVRTLKALMEGRQLTWDEVLDWSSEVAAELSLLHEQGGCHGDITPEGVWIENGSARLSPGADLRASANWAQDILQFSALLRQMIGAVPGTADERLHAA